MRTTIKSLRKEKGWTQIHLAKLLHIDQTTISKWELGKALPDTNTLIALASLFDVSTDYLLCRSIFYYPDNVAALPSSEKEILSIYRRLPKDLQHRAMAYMRNLGELIDQESETTQKKKKPKGQNDGKIAY